MTETDGLLNGLSELRGRYEREVAAARADEDLTQEARDRRIRDLTRDFTSAYAAEKAEIEEALEQRHRHLYRAAHAPEEVDGDAQAALLHEMRHQRVERDLTDTWDRRGAGPTLEEYERALLRGDEIELAVYETHGRRRIKDAMTRESVARRMDEARRERMSPQRRRALKELEQLEKERARVGYVLALRDQTMATTVSGNLKQRPVQSDAGERERRRG
jgi:hypothetical protein